MGLFSRDKPKIKVESSKADGFSGWLKCTHCQEMIHTNELKENFNCCPKCEYHYRIHAMARVEQIADTGTFKEFFSDVTSQDPLKFVDTKSYFERLESAKETSGRSEGVITGTCEIGGYFCALAVMDFNFMAGSMGSAVGERLTRLMEKALEERLPLVVVSASGGARMQESTLSLMQMAKTSAALSRLNEAGVPYISVLTNPTSGGVTASFASLGDVIIAEPKALICFAGPRVVEQVIRQKLPEGAQKSEFLLEHGMIDRIVKRAYLKKEITLNLSYLTGNKKEKSTKRNLSSEALNQSLDRFFRSIQERTRG